MIYKPKYFRIEELVPRDFFEANQNRGDHLWLIFDYRVLWTLDRLREEYGPMILNDWCWGGSNQYRGWRPFDVEIGAYLSQHKFGRAGDPIFRNHSAEKVRQDILETQNAGHFKYITCIEVDVFWFHFDVRNWKRDKYGIKVIKP